MSRYFFDTQDGDVNEDDTGLELGSLAEARKEAIRCLTEMAGEKMPHSDRSISVQVRDENRRPLFRMQLSLTEFAGG